MVDWLVRAKKIVKFGNLGNPGRGSDGARRVCFEASHTHFDSMCIVLNHDCCTRGACDFRTKNFTLCNPVLGDCIELCPRFGSTNGPRSMRASPLANGLTSIKCSTPSIGRPFSRPICDKCVYSTMWGRLLVRNGTHRMSPLVLSVSYVLWFF